MSSSGYKRKRPSGARYAPQRARKTIRGRRYSPSSIMVASLGRGRISGYYGRYSGNGGHELKFFDTSHSFNFDQTNEVPTTGQLVLIPQGVTESTRIGRKATIRSVNIKGTINLIPATGSVVSGNAFLWLILDKQCNGAAASVNDVFTGTNATTALRNMANSSRFIVMKKWVWLMSPQAGVGGALNTFARHFNWYKKCNVPIEYSSTTGVITEIRSNNLFLIAGSDTIDDLIVMTGVTRVRFSDD